MAIESETVDRMPGLKVGDRRIGSVPSRYQGRSLVDDLLVQGYGFIPFNPPTGLIDRVIGGFTRFLAEKTHEEACRWTFGHPEDPDTGFISRTDEYGKPKVGESAAYDEKAFFHYRHALWPLLDDRDVYYGDRISWLEDMAALYDYCFERGQSVHGMLDADAEGRVGEGHVQRYHHPLAKNEHVLRLIHYKRILRPGEILGKGHADRNFGTFQVYESHPALILVRPDKTQVRYKPVVGQAPFFTGKKAPELTAGSLTPIFHVIQVPDDYEVTEKVECRDSIVFFMHQFPCSDRIRKYGDGTRQRA